MITRQIPEEDFTRATTKAVNAEIKRIKETKAHYSNKDNVVAAMDFLFGGKAANITSKKDTRTGIKGFKQTKINTDVQETTKRVILGLTNRREDVNYSLQDNGNKVCLCCNEIYKASSFFGRKASKDGLQSSCKVCESRRIKANREAKKAILAEAAEASETITA